MSNYAVLDAGGLVVNRIVLDDEAAWQPDEGHTIVAEGEVAFDVGGSIADGIYKPPVRPDPLPMMLVPRSISDRQFFQQLAVAGIISEAEALASNAAVIPAPLLAIIDEMPEDQQFGVKMLVSGATSFERDNPVTVAIGSAHGMTADQIDAFFVAAAAL